MSGLWKEGAAARATASAGLPDGNTAEGELLMRKPVGAPASSCYNIDNNAERISRIIGELGNVSNYNWFGDMGDRIKNKWSKAKEKVGGLAKGAWEETRETGKAAWKATGGRRNIRNNTDATICVTGNTRDNKPDIGWLRDRGANSSPDVHDADGVVILPGQKFYATKREMKEGGKAYTSGIIKVGDVPFGWGNAEVCPVKGETDTYYVNAWKTEHHTPEWAKDKHWKLP